MIARRRFVLACGVVLAGLPSAAAAQQHARSVPRIGYLVFDKETRLEDVRMSLRDLGYVEGKTFVLEYRSAESRYERLPELANELAKLPVKVIVARGTPAARAAQQATRAIPIVFIGAGDPVATGLVKSLAKPGGNTTGLSNVSPEIGAKRLDLMATVLPDLSRVGALVNPANPTRDANLKGLTDAAQRRGVAVVALDAQTPHEIDRAFSLAARERLSAMLVQTDQLFGKQRAQITALAAKLKIPICYASPEYVRAGGLMSYGPSAAEQSRRVAQYIDKILKGASPADLPVELPTQFELTLNLKAARALGLAIPREILVRADKVIE